MGYSKRQFVESALVEIGLGSYTFDADPEILASALRQLDALVASLAAKNVPLPAGLPFNPDLSDINETTDIPAWANDAIIYGLAARLGGGLGKELSPTQKTIWREAMEAVMARAIKIGRLAKRATVAGAGNSRRHGYLSANFLPDQPTEPQGVKQT